MSRTPQYPAPDPRSAQPSPAEGDGDKPRKAPRAAPSQNTLRAYGKDWAHFTRWCRLNGAAPLPPAPETIARYLADLASPTNAALSLGTVERRVSGLSWNYAQRGFALDRKDSRITTALDAIRATPRRPPLRKQPLHADEIRAMVATLPFDLRGMRDRAILLLGHAAGLRRSEIVSLDLRKADTPDSGGWIEMRDAGALLVLQTGTGLRELRIDRGSRLQLCPVHALEQWLRYARLGAGPVFVRVSRDGKRALRARLSDKHVARLVKQAVLAAGIRSDMPEKERLALFSGQSLRAGGGAAAKNRDGQA